MPERLAELGIRPEEISAVVLSHLHLDHAGGAHFFPQAKIYVQQEELEHVMADQKNGTLSVFHQKCDLDNWAQVHLQWVPVPAGVREVPLCPGVTIVNLGPGHSYGMLGMLVELESGNYLLTADAIYSRATMSRCRSSPVWSMTRRAILTPWSSCGGMPRSITRNCFSAMT